MKITGKEYKRKLVSVEVEVQQFARSFMRVGGPRVKKLWDKRRCFTCGGKFTEGDMVSIALTDKGSKLVCSKCTEELKLPTALMKGESK